MHKVIIVGGGAAGMMAAIAAARNGSQVTLYEKNEKLGKKLYITGKGRCNVTNACDMEGLFDHMVTNSRFLYSSFYNFNNYDVIDLLEELGCPTKIERGERVFPVSDHSSDVISALNHEMNRLKVSIKLNKEIKGIVIKDGVAKGVELSNGTTDQGDSVIVATGGISYKATGSTGDGYEFASRMGHKITDLSPSLVPFNMKETICKQLQGLSLRNVNVRITAGDKKIYEDFGELLFTHFGISGPTIISASAYIQKYLQQKDIKVIIDLKPALTYEQLDNRILRDFEINRSKQFKNSLAGLLPNKLIPVIIELSQINPDKKVNEISKVERLQLIEALKNFTLSFISLREYNEAIITKGGISVKEINPSTMESKLVKGVYFVGEVLDLDAVTGGFNLQIAWSTGYMAGKNC